MSTISGNYGYNNYYNSYGLFDTSSTSSSSSASGSYSSIYNLLYSSYGINNAVKTTYTTNSSIRSAGENINSILQSLTATGSKSLFNKLNAASSNEKTATVSFDSSKVTDASKLSSIQLNVGQVATTQVNSGEGVSTTGKEASSGVYKFEIQTGDTTKQFSINVSALDTNDSIQQKMAAAVNDAKIGVTASIEYDSKNKTSTLKLESAATGNKNADGGAVFTVKDTTGNLAEKMGITNVSQEAQNAIYTVNNGERQYSASNKIDLGSGVTANLQQAGSTTIDFERDNTSAVDKVKELVSAINSAMSAASNSTERGSSRLLSDLFQMTKAYSSTLERIGVNVSSGGVLTIDEDKLTAAAKQKLTGDDKDGSLSKISLEQLFGGNNSGFAQRLERISNNMKSTQYYGDPVTNVTSTYTSSAFYNKYDSVSSLLDMYF